MLISRLIAVTLAAITITFSAFVGVMSVRLGELAIEPDVTRRREIARRAAVQLTVLAAMAAGASLLFGVSCYRDSRREILRQSRQQLELEAARADALRRERQARIAAEAATQFRNDYLANVSHELRTPLNAIVGWSSVMQRGLLNGRDRDRAVEAVDRNAAALTRIVNELLDVTQLMQGRLKLEVEPLDLRDVVRSAVDSFRVASLAKNITLSLRLDRDAVPVSGDDDRLEQAAWHLLSNAVKYTPEGGAVTVEVSRSGGRARLRVTDSGRGIEAARLANVFEPFRHRDQASGPGLGVGLAIVRHIVELHGGVAEVASEGVGRGAIFTATLPLGGRPPLKHTLESTAHRVRETHPVS